jgi:ribosomal protein L40E
VGLEPLLSTKICPNCNAEVTNVANLCKHCFYDFNTPPSKKKSPLWPMIFLLFGTSMVAAMAVAYQKDAGQSSRVTIDQETESIVFTTTWADRTEAERIEYKEIASIELNRNATPMRYQIDVLTVKGERYLFSQSNSPLDMEAQKLSETTKRPLVVKDDSPAAKFNK